jgi:nucleoredoxin
LVGNESFPFRRADGWVTYHNLPDALVPDDDVVTDESNQMAPSLSNSTMFDIPVADDYYMGLLGSELLTKTGASSSPINTVDALANTRLVALYFSAHWCGPCRGFTPMLIEFYNYLKEEVAPTHGLEIVFVSSDRSESEFQQYYASMPFKAIPFANRGLAQQIKSVFGVRGIPSLVVIDSLSGRIVVSPDDSRREVHQACNMGEQAIESLFKQWLDQTPEESKAMLDILALSCAEAEDSAGGNSGKVAGGAEENKKANKYLMRKKEAETPEDPAAVVKRIFNKLVANGLSPNDAAAEAINRSTQQHSCLSEGTLIEDASAPPPDTTISLEKVAQAMLDLNGGDKSKVTNILSVAKKYVANVQRDPTNPRFRTFRLSNKIFDQITSVAGSIQLLSCIGFSVYTSEIDFVASIPLSVDMTIMSDVLDKALDA